MVVTTRYLFGGNARPWSSADWTASDDRVRGGSSVSHLDVTDAGQASFNGTLDFDTLGGAGFASQRTVSDDLDLDLSAFDGLQLELSSSDSKQYTLIIKDEVLPASPNGREQASISWEHSFYLDHRATADSPLLITVPWSDFAPTYRGQVQRDVEPLDTRSVKRFSFMVRSFFGSQQGDFALTVRSIKAFKRVDDVAYPYQDQPSYSPSAQQPVIDEKAAWMEPSTKRSSWFCCL